MPKKIIFTVINNLQTDQRMHKICNSLQNAGYQVTLLGTKTNQTKPLPTQIFKQVLLPVIFKKNFLFYFEYNVRLFFYLLFKNFDIYGATDLDTILPNFLVSKLKRKPYTYDAHEYFSQLPEIIHRPVVHWVWKTIEKIVVPRTKYAYTINQSYANLFKQQYGVNFEIIRNAALLKPFKIVDKKPEKYILYQGSVNVGRGVEEMIQAMPLINCKLYICGVGDVLENCKQLVTELKLQQKVIFWGQISPQNLLEITRNATLGFTFFTNNGQSYYYSLANRFFDYFHNAIPQLCINFPEYARINQTFEVAILINDLNPQNIADAANKLLNDNELYKTIQGNCFVARQVINWQNEEIKLLEFYKKLN